MFFTVIFSSQFGWSKDDHDMEVDERILYDIVGELTSLTIRHARKKDSGIYECYTENSAGFDHTYYIVRVL